MSYATPKTIHDPSAMKLRGQRDGLAGVNNVENMPCRCQTCRDAYLAAWLKARSEHEYRKND